MGTYDLYLKNLPIENEKFLDVFEELLDRARHTANETNPGDTFLLNMLECPVWMEKGGTILQIYDMYVAHSGKRFVQGRMMPRIPLIDTHPLVDAMLEIGASRKWPPRTGTEEETRVANFLIDRTSVGVKEASRLMYWMTTGESPCVARH